MANGSLMLPTQAGPPPMAAEIEKVVIGGDLSKLTPEQRVSYYGAVCKSLGLNPLTKPFSYITLNGKLTLYALKDCTEQLRNQQSISLTISAREVIEGVYVVTARAERPDGRRDEATGAVPIEGLKGESRANAMMKAETKAKRRVTLSICGLGILDESEADSIPGARIEEAESIDTGGHPVGTQAAADAVAERKIAEGKRNAPAKDTLTPPELQAVLAELASCSTVGEQGTVFARLCDAVDEAGESGDRAWESAIRMHGDPATKPGAVEPMARALWFAAHKELAHA